MQWRPSDHFKALKKLATSFQSVGVLPWDHFVYELYQQDVALSPQTSAPGIFGNSFCFQSYKDSGVLFSTLLTLSVTPQ
jgi:hypothetical protein